MMNRKEKQLLDKGIKMRGENKKFKSFMVQSVIFKSSRAKWELLKVELKSPKMPRIILVPNFPSK